MGQSLGLVAASSSPLANKWPGPEQRDTTRTFQGPSFRGYIRRAYCVWVLDRATMAADIGQELRKMVTHLRVPELREVLTKLRLAKSGKREDLLRRFERVFSNPALIQQCGGKHSVEVIRQTYMGTFSSCRSILGTSRRPYAAGSTWHDCATDAAKTECRDKPAIVATTLLLE